MCIASFGYVFFTDRNMFLLWLQI